MVPAPGQYDADYTKFSLIKREPKYSISRRYVSSAKLEVPGPGNYNLSNIQYGR